MKIKGIIDCDIVNCKVPCMTIEMPICKNFKCDKDCGKPVCQNSSLASAKNIDIPINTIMEMYKKNPVTQALCFQGLEPFDTWDDLLECITSFRTFTNDSIVIYTGYNKNEIPHYIKTLQQYPNIIVKFGRYIPNHNTKYEPLLGVRLASDNQYAEQIS